MIEIEDPVAFDATWVKAFNPRSVQGSADDIRDVMDTIFPGRLWAAANGNRAEFYERYLTRHKRAMRWRRNRGRWGTYFERLVSFGHTNPINQLEIAIGKLNQWPTRNTTGLVFHLSSPATDSPRTRGGPCWHFGEILWHADGKIDLVAVYRNHDFYNKALGNYLALAQLLAFIAQASGKTPGKLICHSLHAYSDKSMAALAALAQLPP